MFKLSFVCISDTILGYNLTDMPTMLNQFSRAVSNVSTLRNEVIHYHEAPPSIMHTIVCMIVFPLFVQVRFTGDNPSTMLASTQSYSYTVGSHFSELQLSEHVGYLIMFTKTTPTISATFVDKKLAFQC